VEPNVAYGPENAIHRTDYLREVLSVTELCELYGVSCKTGYKWIDRYLRQGPAGPARHLGDSRGADRGRAG